MTYAYIMNGLVHELISSYTNESGTVIPIERIYSAEFVADCIDITSAIPAPAVGWSYADGVFTSPPVVIQPTAEEVLATSQSVLCAQIDAAADAAYITIGGPSPGRLAEYQQAGADATAFKAAGYKGAVPVTVQCWATASGITPQASADSILTTAAQWNGALGAIRSYRLLGKSAVLAAADVDGAESAAAAAIASIKAVGAAA